jgi:hypothetical protein
MELRQRLAEKLQVCINRAISVEEMKAFMHRVHNSVVFRGSQNLIQIWAGCFMPSHP